MQLYGQVHHSRNLRCLAQSVAFSYFLISRCCSLKQMGTEAYLGHEKKNYYLAWATKCAVILPGQDNYLARANYCVVILPGQINVYLSCPGKIIILPGQLNVQLSCPGKIIIMPGQINA